MYFSFCCTIALIRYEKVLGRPFGSKFVVVVVVVDHDEHGHACNEKVKNGIGVYKHDRYLLAV